MRGALCVAVIAILVLNSAAAPTTSAIANSTTVPAVNESSSLGDDAPNVIPEQMVRALQSAKFSRHNVSWIEESAAQYFFGKYTPLTDAQADAVIAANESPTPADNKRALSEPEAHLDLAERQHVAHIYKVMNAKFSLEDIHKLFHSESKPIRLIDGQVDTAIAAHDAYLKCYFGIASDLPVLPGFDADEPGELLRRQNFENALKEIGSKSTKHRRQYGCDGFCEGQIPENIQREHDQEIRFFYHNVSSTHILAATVGQPGGTLLPSDAEMDALVAATESPTDFVPNHEASSPKAYLDPAELQHIDNIWKVLNANFTLDEIHRLFHFKEDQPIILTNQQVDGAIAARTAYPECFSETILADPVSIANPLLFCEQERRNRTKTESSTIKDRRQSVDSAHISNSQGHERKFYNGGKL